MLAAGFRGNQCFEPAAVPLDLNKFGYVCVFQLCMFLTLMVGFWVLRSSDLGGIWLRKLQFRHESGNEEDVQGMYIFSLELIYDSV